MEVGRKQKKHLICYSFTPLRFDLVINYPPLETFSFVFHARRLCSSFVIALQRNFQITSIIFGLGLGLGYYSDEL